MKIALIQSIIVWEESTASREHFARQIMSIGEHVDLIILPEMFTTGFTMNPSKVAETMHGPTVEWMKVLAQKSNAAICGSLVIEENGHYFNRLLFVRPEGNIESYDKRHLFALAGENRVYTAGSAKLIVEYKGFKICPLICYDLRFPVFARNAEDYDLLLYVANWPAPRIAAWDLLLRARAMENMSYVAGVNRIGTDANGNSYPGHSQVIDCLGNHLVNPTENDGVFIVNLDRDAMLEAREKFGFLNDRDEFTVT